MRYLSLIHISFALFNAVGESELLCRQAQHDAIEHIALVAEMVRPGVVVEQFDVGGKERKLLPLSLIHI